MQEMRKNTMTNDLQRGSVIQCAVEIGDISEPADNHQSQHPPDFAFFAYFAACFAVTLASSTAMAQFTDKSADLHSLPKVPPHFQVTLFASEPLVRQPCSMAFDAKGRLFVGMGPQYRKPQPETPGDSVVMVLDTDGDGQADQTKVFATGFNAIQGLAWHGRDLWIANAPDLTIVRDHDGDDEADEYVKLYTDLGNLEHGLHGLNWAPDGKLYMSKGNSTDLEFGPDGALWILGWSSGYGAEWEDGQLINEGRVFRIALEDAPPAKAIRPSIPLEEYSVDELVEEFDSPLPVRRINAQDELVRRGAAVAAQILRRLSDNRLTENQETWTIWSLGRMPAASSLAELLQAALQAENSATLNRQVQAVRILAYRANQFRQTDRLADCMRIALRHAEPRVRFAAVQALHEAHQSELVPDLLNLLERESDETIFYAGWQALRGLSSVAARRALLSDPRGAVRRAALLSLLETQALTRAEVQSLAER